MRIIAGDLGGRRIWPPKGQTTRPMPDRVKAACFSILCAAGQRGRLPENLGVADVFAGTGSFGLEALSRGAGYCWFYERDAEAVRRLRRNIDELGLSARATVVTANAVRVSLPPAALGGGVPNTIGERAVGGPAVGEPVGQPSTAGLISLDPPFPLLAPGGRGREDFRQMLVRLANSGRLPADGVVLIRHERRCSLPLSGVALRLVEARTYGTMTLSLLTLVGSPGPFYKPAGLTELGDADSEPWGETLADDQEPDAPPEG